jgi:hypothetical protein
MSLPIVFHIRSHHVGSFTLLTVVLEYATARLIAEASNEIEQGN